MKPAVCSSAGSIASPPSAKAWAATSGPSCGRCSRRSNITPSPPDISSPIQLNRGRKGTSIARAYRSLSEVPAMQETDASSVSGGDGGGNVRIYQRPSRLATLAPLIWIFLAALVLLIVFVLLVVR